MNVWKFRHCLMVLSLICLVLVVGCKDEDCPTCPDNEDCPDCPDCPEPPTPTLANIWPNEDSNAWTYDLTTNTFDLPFIPDLEEPLLLPSLEDFYADLQLPIDGEPLGSASGLYRLAFDGLRITDSGVTAQNLTETIFTDSEELPTSTESTLTADGFEMLLQRIAQARPDLRTKISKLFGEVLEPQNRLDKADNPHFPFFLFGYAWAKNDEGIFSYGDIDMDPSWVYLEADLSVGHEFQMELLPSLADDIILYGRIWSHGSFTAGGLQFDNCVECLYAVDLGIQESRDENGNLLGMFRVYFYGVIVYAPGVGPIFSHERLLLNPAWVLQEEGYLEENIVDLVGATCR